MFGNTLMQVENNGAVNLTKMNGNMYNGSSVYGNDNENMQYVDIDNLSPYGYTTRNSSSAEMILPAGYNKIKIAIIYWGGFLKNSDFDLHADTNQVIKIRKGNTVAYSDVKANNIDMISPAISYTQYQAYADITSFIQKNGAGSYQVGNAPLSTGPTGGGNHGGWCIVVVYENNILNYNSVRVYDGFEQIYDDANPLARKVTLNGLNVPSGLLQPGDARMGILAWEGDANLRKDYLKINGHLFSNAMNQADNPWNGTITDNGISVTSKNPNFTNQMGLDIDMFDVGTGFDIHPNDQTVSLEFGTEADQYFPGVFIFTIKMKDPQVTLENHVMDENKNFIPEINEVLTYTLIAKNKGEGNANEIVLTDTLPLSVSYVPGSIKVIHNNGETTTLSDDSSDDAAEYIADAGINSLRFRIGNGATSNEGGSLASKDSFKISFQLKVNDPGLNRAVPSIINIARLYARSDAGDLFVDDGFSFLNPAGAPLPVTLSNFEATQGNEIIRIQWKTSMEANCKKFILGKSLDGKLFYEFAEVRGHGTTSLAQEYGATDKVNSAGAEIIYYRLIQEDFDGKRVQSKIISVRLSRSPVRLSILPNPIVDHVTLIVSVRQKTEKASIKIFNGLGAVLFTKNVQLHEGANIFTLPEFVHLPAGHYLLQLTSPGIILNEKMIKR